MKLVCWLEVFTQGEVSSSFCVRVVYEDSGKIKVKFFGNHLS
jgi:hypothetical protein